MTMLPELIAHRGYPQRFPENSLAGVSAAIEAGARYVEIDVQLSADSVPVLFHDRTLERVCGRSGAIHDYSLPELAQFHAAERARFGERFAHTPVAQLSQLVEVVARALQVSVFVELKRVSIEHFGAVQLARQVLPLLAPLRGRCVVICFDLEALAVVRAQGWNAIGAIVDDWSERRQDLVEQLKPEFLFCRISGLPPRGDLDYAYGPIAAFSTADPQEALRLARRGIQFVETDDIGALQDALARRDENA